MTTPHDGRCHPYEHLPGCDCFDNPQERNPIQSPSLQEIQRREGVGAAEAMRRQAFDQAHGLRAEVQPLDATKLIAREGWFCTSCGHRHAGPTLGNICVGCSCPVTEHTTAEDDWIRIASQNAEDATARLKAAEADRDKWLEAFNRSEQFQNGPTKRAEAAESQLAALRAALEPIARREHERAVGASALFSVEHWKHNAGQEHPHEPDDDSFIAFENCKHPLCASVRSADPRQVEPVRIGAFDYVENIDGTVTRKDWRDE
jgi:hypothetical protein